MELSQDEKNEMVHKLGTLNVRIKAMKTQIEVLEEERAQLIDKILGVES